MKKSMDKESKIKVATKKLYAKPQLLRYGSVTELTKGAGKSFSDIPTKRS
jgi:hypothetical protein